MQPAESGKGGKTPPGRLLPGKLSGSTAKKIS